MTYYSSKRDQIENGYDPDATIRDAVLNTTITRKNLDEQAERLWQNYVEVNAEDGMTEESADLSPDDFRGYILSLFDEYGY